jgi:hypothetical protein
MHDTMQIVRHYHFGDVFLIGTALELTRAREDASLLSEREARHVVSRWISEAPAHELWRLKQVLDGHPPDERFGREALARLILEETGQRIAVARCRAHRPLALTVRERDTSPEDLAPSALEWIEVQLVDDAGEPVANIAYRIELSDRGVRTGVTNAAGVLRYEDIPGGTCKLTFPYLDEDAWEAA